MTIEEFDKFTELREVWRKRADECKNIVERFGDQSAASEALTLDECIMELLLVTADMVLEQAKKVIQ